MFNDRGCGFACTNVDEAGAVVVTLWRPPENAYSLVTKYTAKALYHDLEDVPCYRNVSMATHAPFHVHVLPGPRHRAMLLPGYLHFIDLRR